MIEIKDAQNLGEALGDEVQKRKDLGYGWTTGIKFRNPTPEEQAVGIWRIVQTPVRGLKELLLVDGEVFGESHDERPAVPVYREDNVESILNQIHGIVLAVDETLMTD